MNRYMQEGLLGDMREGKRVLHLSPNLSYAHAVLDGLSERLLPGEKVYRAHGAERIQSPTGGFIGLRSVGSLLRGLSVDVLVVEGEPTMKQWEDLAVLCSTAELVRA